MYLDSVCVLQIIIPHVQLLLSSRGIGSGKGLQVNLAQEGHIDIEEKLDATNFKETGGGKTASAAGGDWRAHNVDGTTTNVVEVERTIVVETDEGVLAGDTAAVEVPRQVNVDGQVCSRATNDNLERG